MSTGETLATRERGNGASKDGTPLLSLRGVGKSFGPVRALSNVDLDVPAGTVKSRLFAARTRLRELLDESRSDEAVPAPLAPK